MRIGIPKETHLDEKRVALAPAGVDTLVRNGHTVFIQSMAGEGSHFSDEDYRNVGANVVYNAEEVYQRSEMIAKILPLTVEESEMLQEDQILFSFLHLAVSDKKIVKNLIDKKVTAVAYELIEKDEQLPVLMSVSEIAGQLAIQVGSRFLKNEFPESRGVLLGGMAGVAPAAVVILGAGAVGYQAALLAHNIGAQVIVLDKDLRRLRRIKNHISNNITTVHANQYTIARGVKFADVFIGAIQMKGERSPLLVTEDMVKSMKKGAVIIDVSIDQGGCVETSRPTTQTEPVFIKHGVIHYCVPNMPSQVSRTASYALTNASIEYILQIADNGLSNALISDIGLAKGVCTYNGYCTNEIIAETYNCEFRRLHVFATN